MRISLRKDIDPSSYGHCEVQEIAGAERSENDIILIAKRFMASPEPFKVVTVMTAARAATVRRSFAQPQGVAPRRAIKEKVAKNIRSKVPTLVRNLTLPPDAGAYLLNWAESSLQLLPRPQRYSFLEHRHDGCVREGPGPREAWGPRPREKVVDLKLPENDSDDASDNDLEPIDFEDGEGDHD